MAILKTLIIAGGGGGGGGGNSTTAGGGGGSGGYIENNSVSVSSTTYNIVIGDGGAGATGASGGQSWGNDGNNSSAFSLTANGGGGGAGISFEIGRNGGSGGGGGSSTTTGVNSLGGSGSQGNNGGSAYGHLNTTIRTGGGGGGAGAVGVNGAIEVGGNGGAGLASSITGTSVTRGGGGGGAGRTTSGTGGTGGGGDALIYNTAGAEAGTVNTGGGGGSGGVDSAYHSGGAGGSGVVIVSYVTADFGTCTSDGTLNTDYTIATSGANTIFTWLTVGTHVFTVVVASVAPTVTTQAVSSIAQTTATGNGNVTAGGGATVTERGVCWKTSTGPTTADSKASSGTGTGVYAVSMTGLTAGTLYYVRAYAINSGGTSYGSEVTFTTLLLPTVTTQVASSVATTTTTGNGNITSLGIPASCTKRGIVYSTSTHGDPGNVSPAGSSYTNKVEEIGTFIIGAFTEALTGLVSRTIYYARAYAYNSTGYAYGSEVTFTTLGFTNPGNIYASDNTYATLPATSGVLTVEVSKDAGVNWLVAKTVTFTGTDTLQTCGTGSTELWGSSFTRADMVDANFRVRLSQGNISQVYKTFGFATGSDILTGIEVAIEGKYGSPTMSLDLLEVKIHYGTSTLVVQAGSQAFDSTNGTLAVYNGANWDDLAPLASPTFTGTVTLPSGQALIAPALGTPASGVMTNVTGLPAAQLSGAIPSAVTATTQSANDNSTKLATTAYVDAGNNKEFLSRQTIINGGFTVNQRVYASGATLASGAYGHDRWKAGSGGGDYSFTQLPQSTVITIASGKSLIQVVEDKNVIGGTYTLSWIGTATARYAINSATPAGSYVASPISITSQTAGTTMSVEFTNGTLSNVQLSLGSVALPFMPKSYAEELRDCQRYYYKIISTDNDYAHFGSGFNASTTSAIIVIPFPVQLRIAPTLETSTVSNFWVCEAGITTTAIAIDTAGKQVTSINCTVASGLTSKGGSRLLASGIATAYIAFNAEL